MMKSMGLAPMVLAVVSTLFFAVGCQQLPAPGTHSPAASPPLAPAPNPTPNAEPTVPVATVAFMRFTSDSWDEYIFLVETDGTGLRKLTRDENVRESFPQFSPDGSRIVFSRWPKGGTPNIWLMNRDGTGRAPLTNDPWSDMPAWSPDGKHIAFISLVGGQMEIFVMASDGSNRKRLTNNPARDCLPVWSPDGQKIAFFSDRGNACRWWVMNADGSDQRLLADVLVFDTSSDVTYLLLRGSWMRSALPPRFFLAPKITQDEQCVITIDVEKGTRIGLTFEGLLSAVEVFCAPENGYSYIIGTKVSAKSESFDIVDVSARGRLITSGPEHDIASGAIVLPR